MASVRLKYAVFIAILALFLLFLLPGRQFHIERQEAPPEPVIDQFYAFVTAYTSDPAETDDTPRIMANGREVYPGAVACPRIYSFGTKVRIDGEIYTCEDRLHIKYGDRFDIWHETKKEALAFGKKYLLIEVIEQARHREVEKVGGDPFAVVALAGR